MASKIRNRIVNTAVLCFAEHGYHGCTTKEIAASADVTEGSLFRLFESKDKLFAEALDQVLISLLSQAEFKKWLETPDFRDAIHGACLALYSKISRRCLRLATYALLEAKGQAKEKCDPIFATRVSALASRIREHRKSDRRDVDPKEAASVLLLGLLHLRHHSILLKANPNGDKVAVENIVDIWLRGILK